MRSFLFLSSVIFSVVIHSARGLDDHARTNSAIRAPSPPRWPESFEVQYTLSLPYVESVQISGLKIPVHIWYDGPSNHMRMDVYGGLDSTYALPNYTYSTYPRITKKDCRVASTTAGPTGLLRFEEGAKPLPDISSWQYSGTTKMPGGTDAYIWSLTENHFEKTNVYTFYTAQADARPLRLYMTGVNLLSGSHFDEYLVHFTLFNPLHPGTAAIFKPPALCANTTANHQQQEDQGPISSAPLAQALSLMPSFLTGKRLPSVRAAAQSLLDSQQQQQPSSLSDNLLGQSSEQTEPGSKLNLDSNHHLSANRHFIEVWNQRSAETAGFSLALNRYASWSHEAFVATRLGHTSPARRQIHASQASQRSTSSAATGGFLGTFERKLRDDQLPTHVDYRGTGADGVVKDQASCGSCWAFATTGTMTGTWFLATGEALSLSEQQIVDCSWDYEVDGCWGGFGESAMSFIKDAGGAVIGDTYPYLGQNGYCRSNGTSKAAVFRGYKTTPEGDELALMEALATVGPLYVALDAGHPTFKFYSEGVYHRDDCATDRDNLNHAVTLVGYGTTPDGVDYWLIRNSWSKLWGMDGYMKITRKGNDCGITTGAVLAVVDEAAVAKVKAKRASSQASVTFQVSTH